MITPSYKKAFYFALGLHLFLVIMLLTDNSVSKPALTRETKNTAGLPQPIAVTSQQEVVKAVSVERKDIMETVNRLKQEREQKQRAELNRQKEFNRQLELAKQQRIKEQHHIAKLKEEANKIAITRKKQAEEEQKHLKQLAEQKALEAKRIEELKQQQEQLVKQHEIEAKKLADLNKKKAAELIKAKKIKAQREHAEQVKAEHIAAEHAKAERDRKQREETAAAQHARDESEHQSQVAGEVDKYKALIVNAIGQHWILPENVDSGLSSQFRIRLAPNGVVLEVSLTRSSGDPLLDRSAQTAIYKASPLPVPADSETFNMFRDISLTVRPEQIRG